MNGLIPTRCARGLRWCLKISFRTLNRTVQANFQYSSLRPFDRHQPLHEIPQASWPYYRESGESFAWSSVAAVLGNRDDDDTGTLSEEPRGLATGKMAFNAESGLIVRPSFNLFFLMYTQI